MGFLDKVKEQAEKAKAQAQDLKVKVGDKVEEVQGKRKADDLLGELGRFLYAERTGRTLPSADAEIQRLVAELEALEAEGVFTLPTEPSSAPAETAAPETVAPEAVAPEAVAPEAVAPEAVAPEEAAAGGPPTA